MAELLSLEVAKGTPELLALLAYNVRAEVPVRAVTVPVVAESFRKVEHDGDGQDVILTRQRDERLARLRLHVGRVNDCEPPGRKPLRGDEMQHLECVLCRSLIILVV